MVARSGSQSAQSLFEQVGFYISWRCICRTGNDDNHALDIDAGFDLDKAAFYVWGSSAGYFISFRFKRNH